MQNYITAQDLLGFFPEFNKYINTPDSQRNFNIFSSRLTKFTNIQRIFQNIERLNNNNAPGYDESDTITDTLPSIVTFNIAISRNNESTGIGFSRSSAGFFSGTFGSINPDVESILEFGCSPDSHVRVVALDTNLSFLNTLNSVILNNKSFKAGPVKKPPNNMRANYSYRELLGDGGNMLIDLAERVYFQQLTTPTQANLNMEFTINLNDGKYLQALQVAHIAMLAYFIPSGGTPVPLKNINVGSDSSGFVFDGYWDKTRYGKLLAFLLRQSGLVGLSLTTPQY